MSLHVMALSGGMDSAALLNHLTQKYPTKDILTIHCAYTVVEAVAMEEKAARAIADHYGVELLFTDTLHPYEYWTEPVTPVRTVLFTVLFIRFLLRAGYDNFTFHEAYHATDMDADYVTYKQGDLAYVRDMVSGLTQGKVEVLHLFEKMTKAEIIQAYSDTPWGLTWSCTEGQGEHCGVCNPCKKRGEAFGDAGVPEYDCRNREKIKEKEQPFDIMHEEGDNWYARARYTHEWTYLGQIKAADEAFKKAQDMYGR